MSPSSLDPAKVVSREALPRELARPGTTALRLVARVTERLINSDDVDQALQVLVDGACELLGVDRASLMSLDRASGTLSILVARGLDPEVVESTHIKVGEGIAGTVAATGEAIVSQDVREHPAWKSHRRPQHQDHDYLDSSALSVPVLLHGSVRGVMNFNHKSGARPFTDEDVALAKLLVDQAAVAIWANALSREAMAKRALDRELAIARQIQLRQLARPLPELVGVRLAARSQMCDAVGGDFLEVVRLGPRRLVLAIGDVTGHGIGSALLMSSARAWLRSAIEHEDSLVRTVTTIDRLFTEEADPGRFMTLILAELDVSSRRVSSVSAGHPMPLVVRGGRLVETPRYGSNVPLGIDVGAAFVEEPTLQLESGDLVVWVTDGVWESADENGVQLGHQGIARVLASLEPTAGSQLDPVVAVDAVLAAAARQRGGAAAIDDESVLALLIE